MFDLKRPCVDCPFRKGKGEHFRLAPERLEEIKRGEAFQCHRTIDYTHWRNRTKRQGDHPQQCAGLMAVLMRENATNTIMQLAERLAGVDFSGLDPKKEAYESWAAVLAAHSRRRGGDDNEQTKQRKETLC